MTSKYHVSSDCEKIVQDLGNYVWEISRISAVESVLIGLKNYAFLKFLTLEHMAIFFF